MRTRRLALFAAIAVAAIGPVVPSAAAPGATTRQSMNGSVEPNGATPATSVPDSTSPDLSLDGLTVAFSSDATNLVASDTNGVADVFVKPVRGGQVIRASTDARGRQANGASYSPSLSVDGRWLAFASSATNLVAGDTNGVADIFLKDLRTGAVRRVSLSSRGEQANGASNNPFVALFGDFVTFDSVATNLSGSPNTNGLSDAYLRDVKKATTARLAPPSVHQDLPQLPEKVWSERARVSYEGRYVSYVRGTTRNTVENPTGLDCFILDRRTGRQTRIDIPAWAGSFTSMCEEPVMSADGHYVAFTRWSAYTNDDTVSRVTGNVGIGPSPLRNDDILMRNTLDPKSILMYDRISKVLIPISTNAAGVLNGDSYAPSITADGHQIAFVSEATNAVAGDTNGAPDVFVRDLEERTVSRVSLTATSTQANGASARPSISYDGRTIAFSSAGTNVVAGDSDGTSDVFARDRRTDTQNHAPRFARPTSSICVVPIGGAKPQPCPIVGLNIGDPVSFRLRATDVERDPLRFGVILGMPSDATLDPLTGAFSWTAGPDPSYFSGAAALYLPQGRTKEFGNAMSNSEIGVNPDFTHQGSGNGREVDIVFWVQDPRGATDFVYVRYFVRDVEQSARCAAKRSTPAGSEDAVNDAAKPLASEAPVPNAVYPVQLPGTCFTPNR